MIAVGTQALIRLMAQELNISRLKKYMRLNTGDKSMQALLIIGWTVAGLAFDWVTLIYLVRLYRILVLIGDCLRA